MSHKVKLQERFMLAFDEGLAEEENSKRDSFMGVCAWQRNRDAQSPPRVQEREWHVDRKNKNKAQETEG